MRGLPHWKADPKASRLIRLGNATLEAALKFCRAALQLGIVAVAENPATSLAWGHPGWHRMRGTGDVADCELDVCQFGSASRKRTKLVLYKL